jgi:hypothetical protein
VKSLHWVLLAIGLATLQVETAQGQQSRPPTYASIAREGYRLTKVEAEALETALASNPDDLATRAKLLGFYFRGAVPLYGPETTIAARRRHILWLIEYHPGSEVSQLSEATIDAAGNALADEDGYAEAAKLWTQQAQRSGNDAAVLGNAARFFQLSDKEQAAALLLYAIGILGVDMINQNGLPTSHSPAESKSAFAAHARAELERSTDANVVGAAGSVLGQYGLMMGAMFRERFAVDYAPLAETLMLKAQQLDPANPQWPLALEQFRNFRREAGRAK